MCKATLSEDHDIHPRAFADLDSLPELHLEVGKLNISAPTFHGLHNLRELTISGWPITLDRNAFQELSELASLKIQDAKSIHPQAFNKLSKLRELEIRGQLRNQGYGNASLPEDALLPLGSLKYPDLDVEWPQELNLPNPEVACHIPAHRRSHIPIKIQGKTAQIVTTWKSKGKKETVLCLVTVGDRLITVTREKED